jgi:hypothetical protein
MGYKKLSIFMLGLLLSGCTQAAMNRKIAGMAYPDMVATTTLAKSECAQGDQGQCLGIQRMGDKCRMEIALGDTSAQGALCQRLVDGGNI